MLPRSVLHFRLIQKAGTDVENCNGTCGCGWLRYAHDQRAGDGQGRRWSFCLPPRSDTCCKHSLAPRQGRVPHPASITQDQDLPSGAAPEEDRLGARRGLFGFGGGE